MKYTTVFFDLDDTLLDTALNSKEALEEIFDEYKLSNHFDSFHSFHSKYQEVNNALWDLYGGNEISKETLRTERFMKTFEGALKLTPKESFDLNDAFLDKVTYKKNVIEGAIDILEYLKSKYSIHILSNGFVEVQGNKIKNAQMNTYFGKIVLSDHIGINKPDPRLFTHALTEANALPEEVIMIGDNIKADIMGAKNSNIDQIWYNPQRNLDSLNIKPTHTISSLMEIKNIL